MNGLWGKASIGSKLIGAIGALFIATVMLVMSTMAWFTISKTPQATKINVDVSNTQNFEIAKANGTEKPGEVTANDSTNEYAWGEKITFEQTDPIQIELPATIADNKLQTVTFDKGTQTDSGRTAGLTECTAPTNTTGAISYYTYDNKNCAAVMGMWLRTNTTGNITATIPDNGLTISGGNGSFNTNSVTIAIKMGENGQYQPLSATTPASLGQLDASKEGTYVELVVYLEGEGENGVVAYDVGGTTPIDIDIAAIKFTNSNVAETVN